MTLAALLVLAALAAWRWRPRPPSQGPTLMERRERAGVQVWRSR